MTAFVTQEPGSQDIIRSEPKSGPSFSSSNPDIEAEANSIGSAEYLHRIKEQPTNEAGRRIVFGGVLIALFLGAVAMMKVRPESKLGLSQSQATLPQRAPAKKPRKK